MVLIRDDSVPVVEDPDTFEESPSDRNHYQLIGVFSFEGKKRNVSVEIPHDSYTNLVNG